MTTATTNHLADSPWPMIHGTPGGSKCSPLKGPTRARRRPDAFQPPNGTAGLVATVADDLVYYETFANELYCLDAANLAVKTSVSLDSSYPYHGGNTVDGNGAGST